MIIAKRSGTDGNGHRYDEAIRREGTNSFLLECRSTNSDDCFDTVLTLEELHEYMGEAFRPWERTVISGGRQD